MLKHFTFILICVICCSNVSLSQTRAELEKKKKKTEQEIQYANKILNQTKKQKRTGYNKLLIIDRKIIIQENLIIQ